MPSASVNSASMCTGGVLGSRAYETLFPYTHTLTVSTGPFTGTGAGGRSVMRGFGPVPR